MPPKKKRVVKRAPPTKTGGPVFVGAGWAGDTWDTVKKSGIIRNVASAAGGPILGGIAGMMGLGKKKPGRRTVLKF